MKIAFFAGDNDNFCFVKEIIKHFQRQGHEISIIRSANLSLEGLYAHMKWSDLSWFEWGNGPIVWASRMPKVCKIVCRIHRYEIYTNSPQNIDWKNIDSLIFVNSIYLDEFKRLHEPNIERLTRVHIIHNAIDLEKFQFKERGPGFKIAFVGRFHPHKNIPLAIQVMAELVKKDPRYKCFMVGTVSDQPTYQYFKKLLESCGLEDHMIYEGVVDNIDKWLDDKNYLLSTSIIEGHLYNIIEAMAKGIKPVIHNFFGEPEKLFGRQYVFNTISEAIELITERSYNSHIYRELVKSKYNLKDQLQKIDKLVYSLFQPLQIVKENPLVSICIFTYNRSRFLGQAIESALGQTYPNKEIVIVNDGSTDDTLQVIHQFKNKGIKVASNTTNKGRPFSRNRCIDLASGEYIVWLGDDDLLLPETLEHYMDVVNFRNDPDVVYGNLYVWYIDESLRVLSHASITPYDWEGKNDHLINALVFGDVITDGGAMVKKSLYEKYGKYNECFLRAQDYEFWTRICKGAHFAKYNGFSYIYRSHSDSTLRQLVDTSFESLIIRSMIKHHGIEYIFSELCLSGSRKGLAQAFFCFAQSLLQWGDTYNSELYLQGALVHDTSPEKLFFRSLIAFRAGNLAKLKEISSNNGYPDNIRKFAKKLLDSATMFRRTLDNLIREKKFSNVLSLIEKFERAVGRNKDSYFYRGMVYMMRGNNEKAYSCMRQAFIAAPNCENIRRYIDRLGITGQESIENVAERLMTSANAFEFQWKKLR